MNVAEHCHCALELESLVCKVTGLAGCFVGPLSCNPPPFLKAGFALTWRNVGEKLPLLLGGAGFSSITHSAGWPGALFSGIGMGQGPTLGQAR